MRIEGRVAGNYYVVTHGDTVMKKMPLDEARADPKLAASVQRNGWMRIDGSQ